MKKNAPIIELQNVKKSYGIGDLETPILRGVTLTISQGDFVAITGPSGSGKSTLMNIIGLLDVVTHGTYLLNGENVTGLSEDELSYVRNKRIGFVFQSFNLLPRETALENVFLPAI